MAINVPIRAQTRNLLLLIEIFNLKVSYKTGRSVRQPYDSSMPSTKLNVINT